MLYFFQKVLQMCGYIIVVLSNISKRKRVIEVIKISWYYTRPLFL